MAILLGVIGYGFATLVSLSLSFSYKDSKFGFDSLVLDNSAWKISYTSLFDSDK